MENVQKFLETIDDERRRQDSCDLADLMSAATGVHPEIWGSIIGFGKHHYRYETGREGDTVAVGFSPLKSALVLYGVVYYDQNADAVSKLGKYKLGKGCLYIKELSEIDKVVLSTMVSDAF